MPPIFLKLSLKKIFHIRQSQMRLKKELYGPLLQWNYKPPGKLSESLQWKVTLRKVLNCKKDFLNTSSGNKIPPVVSSRIRILLRTSLSLIIAAFCKITFVEITRNRSFANYAKLRRNFARLKFRQFRVILRNYTK